MEAELNFDAEIDVDGVVPVVVFSGDLDLAVADHAWSILEPLIDADGHGLVIDLGAVSFVDSRGLNVLVHTLRSLDGADLTLRNTPDRIMHLLNVSGVADRIRFA